VSDDDLDLCAPSALGRPSSCSELFVVFGVVVERPRSIFEVWWRIWAGEYVFTGKIDVCIPKVGSIVVQAPLSWLALSLEIPSLIIHTGYRIQAIHTHYLGVKELPHVF
jgi:hypothetical protein